MVNRVGSSGSISECSLDSLRVIFGAPASIVAGLAGNADSTCHPVDSQLGVIEYVDRDAAGDFRTVDFNGTDLEPTILASANGGQHCARHSDSALLAGYPEVYLIVKRHCAIANHVG